MYKRKQEKKKKKKEMLGGCLHSNSSKSAWQEIEGVLRESKCSKKESEDVITPISSGFVSPEKFIRHESCIYLERTASKEKLFWKERFGSHVQNNKSARDNPDGVQKILDD